MTGALLLIVALVTAGAGRCCCSADAEPVAEPPLLSRSRRSTGVCQSGGLPCLNSRPCVNDASAPGGYTCQCSTTVTATYGSETRVTRTGWKGQNCSVDINECTESSPSPCFNGGACRNSDGGFRCLCDRVDGYKYTGQYCTVRASPCLIPDPGEKVHDLPICHNGGNCSVITSSPFFRCACPPTYKGQRCKSDVNECEEGRCKNNATCVNSIGSYNCTCHPGYRGTDCDEDVDECAPSPCGYNSTCLQRSNQTLYGSAHYRHLPPFDGPFNYTRASGYVCACVPGTEGVNCTEDINECNRSNPCGNGGICTNQEPGYQCTCLRNGTGRLYGGRNCTVPLTGCDSRPCANNATCRPYYAEGTGHYVTCACTSGWAGKFCNFSTSLSFNGSSRLSVNATALRDFSFDFRTTLQDAVLLSIGSSVVVSLSGGKVALNHGTPSSEPISAGPDTWTAVKVVGASTLLVGDRFNASLAGLLAAANDSSAGLGLLAIGPGSNWSGVAFEAYRGCVRDLRGENGALLYSAESASDLVSMTGVAPGCNRTLQCSASTCGGGNSTCVDLWNTHRCECELGKDGPTCTDVPPQLVFGLSTTGSYAQFAVPAYMRKRLKDGRGFHLAFLLTAKSDASKSQNDSLLAYYGFPSGQAEPKGYVLVTVAPDGRLKVSLWHKPSGAAAKEVNKTYGVVADGQRRAVQVRLSEGASPKLTVDVSGTKEEATVDSAFAPSTFLADARLLLIGGFAGIPAAPLIYTAPARTRRATATAPAELKGQALTALSAVLHDARTAGTRLVVNGTGSTVLAASASAGVQTGEATADVCTRARPCQNGGSCTNVYYNSFRCNCTIQWRGVKCEFENFCKVANTCKTPGYSCFNEPGQTFYECRGIVSMDAASPSVTFTPTNATSGVSAATVSLRLRTLTNAAATLLLLRNATGAVGRMELLPDGRVKASVAGGPPTVSTFAVNDGSWVTVMWSPSGASLKKVSEAESMRFSNGSGGVEAVTQAVLGPFRGCVSSVRVNGFPFALHPNSSASSAEGGYPKWQPQVSGAVAKLMMENAGQCQYRNVCQPNPCANGGRCLDRWNVHECNCTQHFNGTNCTDPVCPAASGSVPHPACLNGGNCTGGGGAFSCSCRAGHLGYRCSAADPCATSPCKNGGTCKTQVKVFGSATTSPQAVASCSCANGWEGDRCHIKRADSSPVNYALIFGILGGLLLILVIILIVLIVRHVRMKRASRGVYNPHGQEMNGSNVKMSNVIKPPPGERLI